MTEIRDAHSSAWFLLALDRGLNNDGTLNWLVVAALSKAEAIKEAKHEYDKSNKLMKKTVIR